MGNVLLDVPNMMCGWALGDAHVLVSILCYAASRRRRAIYFRVRVATGPAAFLGYFCERRLR